MGNSDSILQTTMSVVCVTNDGSNESFFDRRDIQLSGDQQRQLSEQISAVNFRLRTSPPDYASDWHVATDPTLLIILSGCIEIELRNGQKKQFVAGEMFIAEDYLNSENCFDNTKHGHRATVLGDNTLKALHLKLNKRER